MSHLRCPLCIRYVSLSQLNLSSPVEDIYVVKFSGLGRGRGFAISESFSVLDDAELMDRIATRLRGILNLIEGDEEAAHARIESLKIDLQRVKKENVGFQRQVNDLEAELSEYEEVALSLRTAQEEAGALEGEIEELLKRINQSFNTEYEYLEDAVTFLLEQL